MAFLGQIAVDKCDVVGPSEGFEVTFQDPPAPGRARYTRPIGERQRLAEGLRDAIGSDAERAQLGGVRSVASAGDSYVIILFALGAIAAGMLGAMGADIWKTIKESMSKILQKNSADRNVVEVAMELDELDIIFHAESRTPGEIPSMFDDAASIVRRLKEDASFQGALPANVEAIEVRASAGDDRPSCILYSYRRARLMLEELGKEPESGEVEETP